jgi:hypothetical protein
MEKFFFFDSTDTDQRIYQAADFARFFAQIVGNGVSSSLDEPNGTKLFVVPNTNMTVTLQKGVAFINGRMYENTDLLDLTLDVAEQSQDRIDRIVIQLDNSLSERKMQAVVKKGLPSSTPVAPSLQRDGYIYEISLVQIRVHAGKSFIEVADITDERTNPDVCGYIPLHNTLRGINVDQNGLTSLPNQSYFEVVKENLSIPVPDRTNVQLALDSIIRDHQNEVNTSNNTFVPKTSGVYLFFGYVRFPNWSGGIPDVQLYMNVNGIGVTSLFARATSQTRDNIFQGTLFYYLNAGDVVDFGTYIYDSPANTQILDYRVMATKLS